MYKKDETEKRQALTYRQKQLMLSVLIRKDSAFISARTILKPEHFDQIAEKGLALVWSVVLDIYDEDDRLPTAEVLNTEISSRIEDDQSLLNDDQIQDVDDVLSLAFSLSSDDLNKRVAVRYVKRMMEESIQRSIQQETSRGALVDLPTILKSFSTQLDAVQSLEQGAAKPFFPESIGELKPVVIEPSGVPWLDYFMGGGTANKEIYGFLGPYGSCKTTLGVMLAVNRVKYEQERYQSQGRCGPYPIVYLVAWEEEAEQLQLRAISYDATVHKDTFNGTNWLGKLSTAGNFKSYEKVVFKDALRKGIPIGGERERMNATMKMLNQNLVNLDFTGAEPAYRDQSTELAQGVAKVILRDQELRGDPGVSLIVLDYAGAAAERAISSKGLDYDRNLRHFIGKMPINCKNQLAIPFDCPVWILHQTGTEAQSRASGTMPKPTDAAEARNFLENFNFGFLLGTVSDDNICGIVCRKQRRSARRPPKVLHIDGAFSRVHDVTTKYVISGKSFAPRDMASKVVTSYEDVGQVESDSLFSDAGIP